MRLSVYIRLMEFNMIHNYKKYRKHDKDGFQYLSIR